METPDPSRYEERQQVRRDRLNARAAKARATGQAKQTEAVEFFRRVNGQPLLVGHHSFPSDLRRREKNWDKMSRAVESHKQADELAEKAKAVGTAGIASDDPAVIVKLKAQLDAINTERDEIKAVNRIVRKHCPKNKPGDRWPAPRQAIIDDLEAAGYGHYAKQAVNIDFTGVVGIPSFTLSNKTANARRIQQRIDDLEAMNESEAINGEWDGPGWTMWTDQHEGRIYLEIDDRLTRESFSAIRSQGGFNWSRKDHRFVRKITPNALRAITRLADLLDELIEYE